MLLKQELGRPSLDVLPSLGKQISRQMRQIMLNRSDPGIGNEYDGVVQQVFRPLFNRRSVGPIDLHLLSPGPVSKPVI